MTEINPDVNAHAPGLLLHEKLFVAAALHVAVANHHEALKLVGATVEETGGDWAFDDVATRMAAEEAVMRHADVLAITELHEIAKRNPLVPYPREDEPFIKAGSRIVLQAKNWEDTYDIGTHRIKGMPEDEEHQVSIVSVQSPLGMALIGGLMVGDTVQWRAGENRNFSGVIQSIDQTAQREFYAQQFSIKD